MFLQVFLDFVYYIVFCIVLTSLRTVVFFYYRIFQTVFSGQWISKYVRLMSIKISISLFLSHHSEYISILIKVQCSSEAVHMHARKSGITCDKLVWEYLIILFGLEAGLHKFPINLEPPPKSRNQNKEQNTLGEKFAWFY